MTKNKYINKIKIDRFKKGPYKKKFPSMKNIQLNLLQNSDLINYFNKTIYKKKKK